MPADIKGYRMKFIVDEVRKRYDNKGVLKLKEVYGSPLVFNSGKIYSEEENIRLLLAASTVIFGDTSSQSLFETGRILAQTILKSLLLKTGLRLIGKQTIEELLFNQKIAQFVTLLVSNLAPSLDVEIANTDGKTLCLTFKDTAMPARIYEGEWNEYFRILCGNTHTRSEIVSPKEFKIFITSASEFKEEYERFRSFIETG